MLAQRPIAILSCLAVGVCAGCATTATSTRRDSTSWLDEPVLAPGASPVEVAWRRDGFRLSGKVSPAEHCVLKGSRTITAERVTVKTPSKAFGVGLIVAGAAIVATGIALEASADVEATCGTNGSCVARRDPPREATASIGLAGIGLIGLGGLQLRAKKKTEVETLGRREETRRSTRAVACLKTDALPGVELAVVVPPKKLVKAELDGDGNVAFELPADTPTDAELTVAVARLPKTGSRRPLVRGLVIDKVVLDRVDNVR